MRKFFLRDISLALRINATFAHVLSFFGLVILITPLGLPPEPTKLAALSTSIVWIAALLAGLLSVDRLFQMDFEDGTLEFIALAPIPMESVVLAKSAAHWVVIGLPITLLGALATLILNPDPKIALWTAISLALGTPALSLIGAFGAAITLTIKRGGLLLSVLLLPMSVPVLIFGSQIVIRAGTGADIQSPLALLGAISLAAIALLPFASAYALKIALR